MLTIAASVIVGFFVAYFIARSKRHWLLVVLSVLSSLGLFLLIFFGTHIIFLGILQSMGAAVETRSILGLGEIPDLLVRDSFWGGYELEMPRAFRGRWYRGR